MTCTPSAAASATPSTKDLLEYQVSKLVTDKKTPKTRCHVYHEQDCGGIRIHAALSMHSRNLHKQAALKPHSKDAQSSRGAALTAVRRELHVLEQLAGSCIDSHSQLSLHQIV